MTCIRPVQIKWRKFADEVVRCFPDLNVRFVCDSNEGSIGRKLDGVDWLFEIEMVKNDTPTEVDEESPPICVITGHKWAMKASKSVDCTFVYTDQNVPIGTESDGSDVFAVLERKSKGLVTTEIMGKLNAGASMG